MRNIFSAAGALPKKYQKDLVKKYFSCYNIKLSGGVAHLGERDIRIVEVTGSSPAVSTIQKALKPCGFGAFFFYGERDAFCGSSNTFTKVRQLFCSLRLIEETPYPLLKADRVFLIAAS